MSAYRDAMQNIVLFAISRPGLSRCLARKKPNG